MTTTAQCHRSKGGACRGWSRQTSSAGYVSADARPTVELWHHALFVPSRDAQVGGSFAAFLTANSVDPFRQLQPGARDTRHVIPKQQA